MSGRPLADEAQIDHKCCNPACVNPDHLEAVTSGENNRRTVARGRFVSASAKKTHCPEGHPYSGENLLVWKRPGGRVARVCRECSNANSRAAYAARTA